MRRDKQRIQKSLCTRAAVLGACILALGSIVLFHLPARVRINAMAEPLWGQLQKAQDNPQTIEEAIEAAILAHEADPTAHLGEGESLSQHKHETVIDHPAGSLVPDKFSFTEDYYQPLFESLDSFVIVGSLVSPLPNGFVVG